MAIPGLFSLNQALQSDPENVIIKFSGASIALTPSGAVQIIAPGGLEVTGTLNVTGDVTFDSDLDVTGDIVANEVSTSGGIVLSTHTHTGSPTAPTGSISPTGQPI